MSYSPDQLINNPTLLSQVLTNMTVGDGATVKQASALLNAFAKNPHCVGEMQKQLNNVTDAHVRLQAALFLKQKIKKLYKSLGSAEKLGLSSTLLQMFTCERDKRVMVSLASAVANIAPSHFKDNAEQWPELFHTISNLQKSEDPSFFQKQQGYELLGQICEVSVKYLKSHATYLVYCICIYL